MRQIISDEKILSYIKKVSNATIKNICTEFKISESTARRALVRLARADYINRYKGGAIALVSYDNDFGYRFNSNRSQKDMIARKAAEKIEEDSVVILLGGTTVSLMCPYLSGRKLTVITNSLPVIDQLKEFPDITLVMLGGIYNREELEFFDNVTTAGLRLMHADYLFMSCVGFSTDIGFMTDHIDSIDFYKLCMKNTDKTYMLADSAKSKLTGISVIAETGEIDCIITDGGITTDETAIFNDNNVEVIIVQ